jgi:hypothetical protein
MSVTNFQLCECWIVIRDDGPTEKFVGAVARVHQSWSQPSVLICVHLSFQKTALRTAATGRHH